MLILSFYCFFFPFSFAIKISIQNFLLFFLNRVADENCSLLEVLEAIRPHLQLTFENVLAHINTIYVLQTRQGAMGKHERYLRLKVCIFSANIHKYFFYKQLHKNLYEHLFL